MTKLVTITAKFQSKEHFANHAADDVRFSYDDGGALTPQDAAKVEKITAYYLNNRIFPAFLRTEDPVNADGSFQAETWIDLGQWTKDGLPTFQFRDMTTGQLESLPRVKSGRKRKVR